VTSQFEQHLRAVADLPLGSTAFTSPAGVMVNLLGGIESDARDRAWEAVPEAKIHDYGKGLLVRGRKSGPRCGCGDLTPRRHWSELITPARFSRRAGRISP